MRKGQLDNLQPRMSQVLSPKSITTDSYEFDLMEFMKSARDKVRDKAIQWTDVVSEWAAFNTKTRRGSLAGKMFTGGYALIFGWFFFHTLFNFGDILIPSNITWKTYFYYYGTFLLSVLIAGITFCFLCSMLVFESLSDDDGTRWPLTIGNSMFVTCLISSNMSGEPYPDLKRDWLDSDLRYPEFMNSYSFVPLLGLFLSDMVKVFGTIEEESSETFLFRPLRAQGSKDKQRVYDENFTGLLGAAFIYFSYIYFLFALTKNVLEGMGYYVGLRIARSYLGRGHHFESGRKSMLIFVPILAGVQGYFAYRAWCAFGSDFAFYARALAVLMHLVLYAGWHCSQDSWLGGLCLPYKRKEEYKNLNFDVKDVDNEDEDENENKKLIEAEDEEQ